LSATTKAADYRRNRQQRDKPLESIAGLKREGQKHIDQQCPKNRDVVLDVPTFDRNKFFPVVNQPIVGKLSALRAFMRGRKVIGGEPAIRAADCH
jgi:hypothetical protein